MDCVHKGFHKLRRLLAVQALPQVGDEARRRLPQHHLHLALHLIRIRSSICPKRPLNLKLKPFASLSRVDRSRLSHFASYTGASPLASLVLAVIQPQGMTSSLAFLSFQ